MLLAGVLMAACGGDAPKRAPTSEAATAASPPAPALAADTAPVDLSTMTTALPDAVSDSVPVAAPDPETVPRVRNVPDAPPALAEAVEREGGISRFCYQEFGQKADPQLRGGVAMVLEIAPGEAPQRVATARVAGHSWSSAAGEQVNRCLVDKIPKALRLQEAVKPGRYVVQLRFRAS